MTRIVVTHSRIGRTIEADDIFDIAAELMLLGDRKEWGTIEAPSFHLEEGEYLEELEKKGFTIKILNKGDK